MKKLTKLYPAMPIAAVLMPLFAHAQTFESIITAIKRVVDLMIPLFMALAVAVFLWGIVKYITAGGDAEKEKTARGYIIFGLIGIFVLIAFYGIVMILANTFGIQTGGTLPQVNIPY